MGTALASTGAERQQALQQLYGAFGQPDGSMAFTFNGHVYQTTGINSDGTMNVLDMNTRQITNSVDPVNVYEAALPPAASSADPSIATPAANQPSMISTLMGGASTTIGMIQLIGTLSKSVAGVATTATLGGMAQAVSGYGLRGVQASINAILNIPGVRLGLGAAGAVLGGYSLAQGTLGVYKNGITAGGALNLGMGTFGVATGINGLLGGAFLSNPAGWVAAGAVITGSLAYAGINDWITNGFSVGAMATTTISTIGLAVASTFALYEAGMISLYEGLLPLLTNPIGWAIAGAVVLFSVLWSLFHQPPPEVLAMRDLNKTLSPMVWSAGPVLFVAAGATALLMGWPKGAQAPIMASITVPQSYITSTLGSIPLGSAQSPTVLVEHGNGSNPGSVVIVSPQGIDSRGNAMMQLSSYALPKNLEFVSSPTPPQESYIPFFIYKNGKAVKNPDIVKALTNQDSLLRSLMSGGLDAQEALSAMQLAAATDKYGVTPSY